MTTVDLRHNKVSIQDLLSMAMNDSVIIVSEDGHEFILEESDEFEKEVVALSKSESFIEFLKKRATEPATITTDELEKELGLGSNR